jgi:hypothetical protein
LTSFVFGPSVTASILS